MGEFTVGRLFLMANDRLSPGKRRYRRSGIGPDPLSGNAINQDFSFRSPLSRLLS
jgi:hypothetical protein